MVRDRGPQFEAVNVAAALHRLGSCAGGGGGGGGGRGQGGAATCRAVTSDPQFERLVELAGGRVGMGLRSLQGGGLARGGGLLEAHARSTYS